MFGFDMKMEDNSKAVLEDLERRKKIALLKLGVTAEGFAKKNAPVDLGTLRQSISHTIKGDDVYIGTNNPIAPYVEYGTGIYATDGKGRKSPWSYKDRKGKWHYTRGIRPRHFLRNAASQHTEDYIRIITETFKK